MEREAVAVGASVEFETSQSSKSSVPPCYDPPLPWHRPARELCRRHGFPPGWLEDWEANAEIPEDPRAAVAAFEQSCLVRLTRIWTGEEPQDTHVDGNLAAYLVQRYLADAGRSLARRYRMSSEEWEDLVSAAAERALKAFETKPIEAPRAYLWTSLRHAVWEYIRKARREVATEAMPLEADRSPDPAMRAEWAETMSLFMEHCYGRLEPRERELFEDLVIHGRTAAEVGEAHEIAANAVNVRKFRIRKWLRECLAERTGIEDPFE